MFFLQAARAPVVTRYRDKVLFIPKVDMDDIVLKGAELGAQKTDQTTDGMNPNQKREFLTLYPNGPLAFNDIKAWIRTTEGAKWVFETQLPKARVFMYADKKEVDPLTPEEVEQVRQANGTGRVAGLAWVLADLNEDTITVAPDDEDVASDPLKLLAKLESTGSRRTTDKTSATSPPLTPGQIGEG